MEGCERTSRSIVNPNGACAGREAKERTKDDLGTRPRHNLSFILGLATLQTFWCTTRGPQDLPYPFLVPQTTVWSRDRSDRDSVRPARETVAQKAPSIYLETDDLIRGALVVRGDDPSGLIPR